MIQTDVERREVVDGGRLAELYLRHGPAAIRLAYLLTGDRTLAEDLVHDAFVRLAGRFLDVRDPMGFDAYLRKTVLNLSRMHFRHRRVEREYVEREARRTPTETVSPDIATREAIRQALYRLPERQRAAIVLRYYEDLSEAQAAEALRCPVGTVKSLVSRGMEALRREMRDA